MKKSTLALLIFIALIIGSPIIGWFIFRAITFIACIIGLFVIGIDSIAICTTEHEVETVGERRDMTRASVLRQMMRIFENKLKISST